MKVISFVNRKGGVGKTSISYSVAVSMAKFGRVCAIDLDSQGSMTSWANIEEMSYELADFLYGRCELKDVLQQTSTPNLFILPTAAKGGDLNEYNENKARKEPFRFVQLKKDLEQYFDYLIYDSSPAWSGLEENCCLSCDEIVTVLKLDRFSADGLDTFNTNLSNLRKTYDGCHGVSENGKPDFNKIVLNENNNSYAQCRELIEAYKPLEANGYKLFIVPQDLSFRKAQQNSVSIQDFTGTKAETLKVIDELAESLK